MSVDQEFDPHKNLAPETPAKVAKVAKEDSAARAIALASLAALAARSVEPENFSTRGIASSEHKICSEDCRRASSRTSPPIDVPAHWAAGVGHLAPSARSGSR